MTSDSWVTDEDIAAAIARFAAAIPDYEEPAAYGVGLVSRNRAEFPYVVASVHRLPAVVLATVCGHSRGTATYELTTDDLDRAIELLTPAEAATHRDHPNLRAWRELRRTAETTPDAGFVAVFVQDLRDPISDQHDAAFRRRLDQQTSRPPPEGRARW